VGESAITAIICMQPYVSDSRTFALHRVVGTVIGAFWGLVFLLLMRMVPAVGAIMPLAYLIMAIMTALTLYSCIVLRQADSAALAAIVFLCAVIAYPDISSPLLQVRDRLVDTLIGTFVAIAVNVSHLPRRKHPERVLFIRTKDLVPDRFAQVPSSVLIGLNRLYRDGAKICLVSEHAPAFFIPQMGTVEVNTPMIMMDGAVLYDLDQRQYLEVTEIPQLLADTLRSILDGMQLSYRAYVIRARSMLIFRYGCSNEWEQDVHEKMKRSPYRNYMDGSYEPGDRIAFLQIIDKTERITLLRRALTKRFEDYPVRIAVREFAGFDGVSELCIYSASATVDSMKEKLTAHLESERELESWELFAPVGYRHERDALALLGRIRAIYEPVIGFERKRIRQERKHGTHKE